MNLSFLFVHVARLQGAGKIHCRRLEIVHKRSFLKKKIVEKEADIRIAQPRCFCFCSIAAGSALQWVEKENIGKRGNGSGGDEICVLLGPSDD
ncbi:hypothetical protein HPP92_013943 [Vanilla planifolia]|uniref:Uncharacterized protein n=1 Tax=Vanilla planifolia TaxID=51239 RepID=A0A835QSW7_VANPL|nr:hypothetical protein HPP92_013943 [Vanilla planifolia]